jgi:hypothetical protein
MSTLVDLNNYSDGTISYTDVRGSDVVFNFPTAVNLTDQTITTTSFTIERTIDIVEIVQPAQALVSFSVDVSALSGATVSWGTPPSGVAIIESSGVYTVSGIDSISDWNFAKLGTITLTGDTQGSFYYDCTIAYTQSGTRRTKEWQVGNFKAIAELTSSASVSCTPKITRGAFANPIMVLTLNQAIGENIILARFSVAPVTPTIFRDAEATVSTAFTASANVFALRDFANRYYDFDNEEQFNGSFSSSAVFGTYLSGDDRAIFVSSRSQSSANIAHILSTYDPPYWDADPGTMNPHTLSSDGGSYSSGELDSVVAYNFHEEFLGSGNEILEKGLYAFNFSGVLAVIEHDRSYQSNDLARTQAPYGEVTSFDKDAEGGAGFRYVNNGTKYVANGRYTVALRPALQTYNSSGIPTSTWQTTNGNHVQVAYINGPSVLVHSLNLITRDISSSAVYTFTRPSSYNWKAIDSDENYWYMTAQTNASGDGAIYLRNMSDGSLERTITTSGNVWDSLRVAGAFIVVSNSTTTHVYRISNGALVQSGLNGGYSLATNGQDILIGNHTANSNVGEAYLYDISTGTLRKTFSNPNIETTSNIDKFGYGVAMGLDHVAISAIDEDKTGTNEGVVYLYR